MRSLFIVFLASFTLLAHGGTTPDFRRFVDSYFRSEFEFRPDSATVLGFHEYDARPADLSAAAIARRVAQLQTQVKEAEALAKSALAADEKIDRELIENQIRSELLDLQTRQVWRTNPMFYVQVPGDSVDGLIKRDFAPADARLRSVIARLSAVPKLMTAMRANLSNPAPELTELGATIAESTVSFLQNDVGEWGKKAAGKDKAQLKKFDAVNARAVKAMGEATTWLRNTVQPRAKGSFALGEALFLKKLALDDQVSLPLDKLAEIGQKQLERDYDAFVATAKTIDPGKTPAEVMKAISLDHPKEDGLSAAAKSTLADIEDFLNKKQIVTLPTQAMPLVMDTPSYLRAGGFAMEDAPGPFEAKATEAFYYVTPPEKNWDSQHKEEFLRLFNAPVLKLITIHEAYPGHYTQFLFGPRFPTKTRKIVTCYTNIEGWAHYTEQMLVDEGYGNGDPKIRLAQLSEALVRDVRYVAAIGLHAKGMSVEEATKLFMQKAFMEHANAREEAMRGTYDAPYLGYTLGKLMIFKLREDYQKAKGPAYSLRAFHDAFLAQGGIPIPAVRQVLLPGDTGPVL